MTAVDTSVGVRLLANDDLYQTSAAESLFGNQPVWIAKTVLLEADWVLRSAYGFDETAVRQAFTKLLGLENVEVEDPVEVAGALALTHHGLQFADALHLSSRPVGAAFVSFDRPLVRNARRAGIAAVSELKR
jgi:predicted nucleic-acid-binding protein